ncbi:caspase, EACC1-associated type [Kitasatospora sp. NPDC004531]
MSRQHALLIGTAAYQDPSFAPLPSVRADIHLLSQVLELPSVGRFEDCVRVEDASKATLRQSVEAFLNDREPDELVVLYLSGHGEYDTEDGQLYYVASDTRADELRQTAVEASFITEQLEACAARRKVLLLDCCFSGAAVQGFRSKGSPQQQRAAVVEASGVYVITASHQWEPAFAGTPGSPSQFTAAMVDGLHSGKADLDGDGKVSADDLFRYVSRALKDSPDGRRQTPTKSSLQVTGDIWLANAAVGRQVPALRPLPGTDSAVTVAVDGSIVIEPIKSAPAVHDDAAFTAADWPKLFDYYLSCLHEENSTDQLLPLVGNDPPRAVWPTGSETLLSGTADSAQVPTEVVQLAERAAQDGADLWYGYPVVVMFDDRRRQVCAPLFMQEIELAIDAGGRKVAEPAGPIVPHPKLILERLGKDEGQELLASFAPNWRPGFRDEMVRDVRTLLDQLGLPDTEHLDPGALGDGSSLRAAHEGARNVAMAFAVRGESPASAQLVKDYSAMRRAVRSIPETALGALARTPESEAATAAAAREVRIVAPLELNEGQEAVIRSAMSRRITVATGPPGTGKSQLIVNAVATARAAGQSVLVASTNNKAVDEVWERCEELAPGLLIRTGSRGGERDNVEDELRSLERLARTARPGRSTEACRGELRNAVRALDDVRREFTQAAEREQLLAAVGRSRQAYADKRACDLASLSDAFGDDATLGRWLPGARRAGRARVLGGWRRGRLLRRLSTLPVNVRERSEFAALLDFAENEAVWRTESVAADAGPQDADLAVRSTDTRRLGQQASHALLHSLVADGAMRGRAAILERIETVRTRSPREWTALDRVLPHVPGWAVTTRSARRFRDRPAMFDLVIIDEASQCSTLDVLPLLFRAKRALVIGDPMQLSHITKLLPRQEAAARSAAGLRASWLEEHRLCHRRYSSFQAAAKAAGNTLLLDEHYRCHPDIVQISNRHCYGGRLTVLTQPSSLRRLDGVNAVQWLDVVGSARRGRAGSWINEQEAERVRIAVERLLRRLPAEATIGVVTPFRAQKELLARGWEQEPRVRVGTVHTFQGGQQDVMVLSLVAGEQLRPSAVNWLCREVNLWNVAVTRARAHLIVVGDRSFWSRRTGMSLALLEATADGADLLPPVLGESDEQRLILADRFQKVVADTLPNAIVDRDVAIDGYRCDFDVQLNGTRSAVLLDHAMQGAADPARHLRLALAQAALLPGGVRVPAWHIWAGRTDRLFKTAGSRRLV